MNVNEAKELLDKEEEVIYGHFKYKKIISLTFIKRENGFKCYAEILSSTEEFSLFVPVEFVEKAENPISSPGNSEIKENLFEIENHISKLSRMISTEKNNKAQELIYEVIKKLMELDTRIKENEKIEK